MGQLTKSVIIITITLQPKVVQINLRNSPRIYNPICAELEFSNVVREKGCFTDAAAVNGINHQPF